MKTKHKQQLPDIQFPPEIEEIDLTKKIYPITEYVDESGRVVVLLRGEYETGDNDGASSLIDIPGYRTIRRRTRWISDLDRLKEAREVSDLLDLNARALPIVEIRQANLGGHTTLWAHENVTTTKIRGLVTQNPILVDDGPRGGWVEDGPGENKGKHWSPKYHGFDDFSPMYLPKVFRDTLQLPYALHFECDSGDGVTTMMAGRIVYVNPHNHQVSVYCKKCAEAGKTYPWHPMNDFDHKKADVDKDIMGMVCESPGITIKKIIKALDVDKNVVNHSLGRLKAKAKVRTRKVGKTTRVYPFKDKIL